MVILHDNVPQFQFRILRFNRLFIYKQKKSLYWYVIINAHGRVYGLKIERIYAGHFNVMYIVLKSGIHVILDL